MLKEHHSNTESKRKKFTKWLLRTAIIFFSIFMLLAIAVAVEIFIFEKKYEFRLYPNIYVGNINIGGQTSDEAAKLLNQRIDKFGQEGIIFEYNEKKEPIAVTVDEFGADLAYDIISFDTKKTVEDAYDIGRNSHFLNNLTAKAGLIFDKKPISMRYEINNDKTKEMVKAVFPEAETPYRDAELKIKDGQVIIEKEADGKAINYAMMLADLNSKLLSLDETPIKLIVETTAPKIKEADLSNNNSAALVQAMVDLAPIELNYQSNKWTIDKNIFKEWITLKAEYSFCSTSAKALLIDDKSTAEDNKKISENLETGCNQDASSENAIKVGLNEKAVLAYFAKKISPKLDINPNNSKFQIQNGKVAQFQVGKQGQKMEPNKNFMLLELAIAYNKVKKFTFVVDKKTSEIDSVEEVNDLGISEIIGTGKSNFAGSPNNRRHNIKTGGSTLHGILIKPGEEFSLIKTLGKIDGTSGYLTELVIKDNKTIPEYGGGLCQIGTTVFRAALASGLPITARTNHSYRVPYYEPAGTDATIYDPWPDFRFLNDTGNYILIQMRMSGSNISFDFWGKKDGRKVMQTKPVVYNLVKPKPTKIVETTTLKPGVKKCTEKAHTGADASFDYKVTYADGTIKEKTFNSHYKPWQAVCLLGVEKITAPATDTKTSDINTTPTNTSVPNTSTSTQKTTTQ